MAATAADSALWNFQLHIYIHANTLFVVIVQTTLETFWLVIIHLTTESENSLDFVLTSHVDRFRERPHADARFKCLDRFLNLCKSD